MDQKVFIIVNQDEQGRQTFRHVEAEHIFEIGGEQFKFQADFIVKHARNGECAIINNVVVFCQVR